MRGDTSCICICIQERGATRPAREAGPAQEPGRTLTGRAGSPARRHSALGGAREVSSAAQTCGEMRRSVTWRSVVTLKGVLWWRVFPGSSATEGRGRGARTCPGRGRGETERTRFGGREAREGEGEDAGRAGLRTLRAWAVCGNRESSARGPPGAGQVPTELSLPLAPRSPCLGLPGRKRPPPQTFLPPELRSPCCPGRPTEAGVPSASSFRAAVKPPQSGRAPRPGREGKPRAPMPGGPGGLQGWNRRPLWVRRGGAWGRGRVTVPHPSGAVAHCTPATALHRHVSGFSQGV